MLLKEAQNYFFSAIVTLSFPKSTQSKVAVETTGSQQQDTLMFLFLFYFIFLLKYSYYFLTRKTILLKRKPIRPHYSRLLSKKVEISIY